GLPNKKRFETGVLGLDQGKPHQNHGLIQRGQACSVAYNLKIRHRDTGSWFCNLDHCRNFVAGRYNSTAMARTRYPDAVQVVYNSRQIASIMKENNLLALLTLRFIA
ncbi:MAG: hypothetical protein ACRER2_10290, partial [Methylococcales bacterium]